MLRDMLWLESTRIANVAGMASALTVSSFCGWPSSKT